MHGVLVVAKPTGPTSHDVVARFRRAAKIKKVGHTGTLDPLATGLLILCVGKTTRLQSFLMGLEKTYEGEIQFGWATDTYDAVGNAIGDPREVRVDEIDFSSVIGRFVGEIDQMPPPFSAKKVGGERAYEIARRGETPELRAKRVTVYELDIIRVSGSVAEFRVRCSAGTYLRSIAHDLGAAVGIGAHLKSLRRTVIGQFDVNQAIASEKLVAETGEALFAKPHFISLHEIDLPLAAVVIDPMQERKLLQGQTVIVKPDVQTIRQNDLVTVSNLDDELIAIAQAVDVLREGGGPVAIQPRVVLKD